MEECEFVSGGSLDDECKVTTTSTTSTTPAPTEGGCCDSDVSQKKFDNCIQKLTQDNCERMSECFWVPGDDAICEPPVFTTISPTPAPTDEPGCCDSDVSQKKFDNCIAKDTQDKCERMADCFWVPGDDAVCEPPIFTTEPEPGCCYGNPEAAYSKRWFDTCTGYLTERECLMLTDEDGLARCFWEPLGGYEDCEQTWPTTTSSPTEPAGCCYGDSYQSNDKCLKATSQDKCESKGCSWKVTDDPGDCEMTTTESEQGCCAGTTAKNSDMCNEKEGRDACERSDKCVFRADEEDCSWPTTTSEPWLGAKANDYDLPVNPYKRSSKQRRA